MLTTARFGIALSLVAALAVRAGSQVCVGAASFANGPVRVGTGAVFTDGAKSFGGAISFGAAQGAFGGASLSAVSYDDIDEGGTVFGVNGGFGVPFGSAKKAEICPIVGFSYQTGPDVETVYGQAQVTGRAFGFGASIGGIASSSPGFDFIPFVSAVFNTSKGTAKLAGTSSSSSEDYGSLSFGAGFVISKVLTIQPHVALAVGLEDSEPNYGLYFAVNLGSRPK